MTAQRGSEAVGLGEQRAGDAGDCRADRVRR